MKQLKQLLLVMAIALICNNYAQAQTTPFNHYSEWMAKSRENYVYINNGKNDFWRYDDGLMYESILDTYEHYKNNGADLSGTTLLDEVKWYLNNSLTKGTQKPNNYKSSELDDVRPAKLVWKYYNTYPTDTDRDYLDNCEYVMDDIENMRRAIPNDNTSPWEHKESYGNQVWLDGIFMCIPYYTLAGPTIGLNTNSSWTTDYIFQDAYTQIMVTDEKTYDRKTNLWKHAWDALGTRTWADCQNKELYKSFNHTAEELAKPVGTGTWQSLHTWGRALGWYVMAIMETIDNMIAYDTAHSTDHSTQINNLKILFKRVVDSYIQYRDESNGCWYCVLDVDDTKVPYSSISVNRPNYLEGTCSSMFTYALLHGVNKGYLPLSYTSLAKKAYKDLVEYFIKADGEKIKLDNCISVAGLDDGAKRRDGSFAYYMDESVIASDSKGVGPFIWASLEAEKMGYTLVKNSSNFSVNFNSLDQTGINVYKWSKVYDEIDNLSAEYTSPTFTAKTVAGTTIANSGITFNSNNPSVATVSQNGTVTLVGTGLATITATKDEMVSYYSVKVNSIQPQVETPAISIAEGTNTFIGENTTVTIACDTENADIYYTTDGSEPDNTATHYTGTFTISATTTVKAIAIKTGYDDSEIASETFTQDNTAPTLEDSTPNSGATNVSTSGTIVLTFSEDVACTTNATLTPAGGGSAVNLTPTVSGSTVTYSYSGLSNSTSYTFNLAANSVADLAGNNYASAINFGFTTGAAPVNNTYSFGFNQAILDSYDSNGTLLSNPSHDGTVIDISSTSSCGTANVTSTATKENCVSISSDSGENYNTNYVEIHSTEDIKSVYLVAAVTGSTSASEAVAVGWTATPAATISEYHTFTTPGKGDTSGKEINISFTTEGIKYVRLYRKIKLDSSTKTTFTSSSSTTIPNSAATYGIAFIKVTTQTGSTPPTPSKVATPVITGTTPFSSSTSVTMSCETTGATIHYTTDGSTPTSSSATYSEPINISASTTVKAIAVKEGMTNSEVASKTFTQDNTAPTVTMTTPSATTDVAITTSSVVLTVSEEVTAVGENIAGTFNGSAITFTRTDATHLTYNLPDLTNSTTYNIQLNANQIQDAAGNKNAETSFSFTTVAAEQEQVATPSITGTTPFTDNTTVTITCATDGATIHYTIDGSTPTASSATYSSPIAISATTTVKAIAVKSGMTDSDVASATFTKSGGGGGEETPVTITIGTSTSTSYAATFTSSSTNEHITASATAFTIGSSTTSSNSSYSSATAPYSIKYKPNDNIYTSEYSDAYSVSAQFTVANGYTFTPTAISTTIVTEAVNYTYQAVLTDGTTTYTSNDISSSSNGVSTFSFPSLSGTALSGTVTYKIRFKSTANNKKFFVVNLPITISGTVSSSSTPPTPTYTVTATSNNNSWGTVSVDKATAAEDATVTITTTPASGYELTSLTATDGESNPVTITNNQFTMPASNVTVNATFAALPPVLGAVTFSPAGGNYSSEQNVTISATNAEEIWYSTVSQAAAVKNGANATQYTSAIHIGEGSTTLYATAYLGESTTTGSATYTVTIPDVGDGMELYTFSMSGSTINFANGDSDNFSITNNKSCEINNSNIKFRWHASNNEYGQFTLTSKNNIPIYSVKLEGTIEGDQPDKTWGEGETVHQNVAVTNGTYAPETMTWTANSNNVTSVTFTNNFNSSANGNIFINKIIITYLPITTTISSAKYATYVTPAAIDFTQTEGITAFKVTATSPTFILTEVNDAPANTPVVLKGEANTYTLHRATEDLTSSFANNQLRASDGTVVGDESTIYVLGKVNGVVGFGKLRSGTILAAGKAYLLVSAQQARNFYSFNDAEIEQPITTGLNGFSSEGLLIDDDTPLYNLSGQRVSKSYKGIVIINGKKVLRK